MIKTAIGGILIMQIVVILALGASWCGNLYKLTQCDFQESWKGEIIHAVGLFPPASIITVWFNDK